jgi:hypothetical protein
MTDDANDDEEEQVSRGIMFNAMCMAMMACGRDKGMNDEIYVV